MSETQTQAEVIVVGGGLVGASLACLLGEAGVAVTVLDARPGPLDGEAVGRGQPAQRVSAVTPVSQRLLERLGVWPAMAARRVTPYTGMQVWDAEGSGEISFDADQAGTDVLGHIVENDVMLAALESRLAELPSVSQIFGARLNGLQTTAVGRRLILTDGRHFCAPLVVAADGARSQLRELAGIDVASHETGHAALVTTVRTGRGHGGMARQVFLSGGPLAFLPLSVAGDDRYCSIVWSAPPADAARLCALPREALGRELAAAFEQRLGTVEPIDDAVHIPLTQRHAGHYVEPGLALVGDAAHSIHPLAGQGVNLGFMDAAVLAEELIEARRRGAELGDVRILSRYARRRRGDNAAMLALMDGFRLLFGARHPALRLVRNVGLSGVDRLGPVKRLLMRQAIGERGRLPASCR
ncbi:UbiH/UbiF/VisC/COQ6 family ubiquinone biosynthesis hydroxylase [Halomonas sp. McH1-25]|nr:MULTISPECIES: UbiH/UbiF/VisC/COQ6 family ubiquinone biosynthesis hydroxylase [unclassified Halomonas]MCG7599597.1 UbiH/UbiF/VisC/COQ6 family ubiquinone biosynthesis hydroxylase [Halomonas sp. McH1-25]MCP1342130.1 UbiH/UbiF/VisC/COQ6 family ubiquinone biosynthesis hydroxylase [Halomonas sp. FL8]MCP1362765.1 UbiH/UbiF/VisC/COQ6 family ubiquinone biosynthesis hydroxylase [Halomonas sp. BBD45]